METRWAYNNRYDKSLEIEIHHLLAVSEDAVARC